MTSDSAVRKPRMTDPHRGLHLVYSRNARQERSPGHPAHEQAKSVQRIRGGHAFAAPGGPAAAPVYPIVGMGRALLRWMHLL